MARKNELQEEAERKDRESAPFRYHPIDPKKGYNRLEFLVAEIDLEKDMRGWQEQLIKDPYNPKIREKISRKLYGDPKAHLGKSPDWIRKEVKTAFDDGTKKMAEYVGKNLESFLELFKGQSLVGLLMSLPLYQTGNKEHDRVVSAINHVREMDSVAKEGDINKIREIVMESMKQRNVPDYAKTLVDYFSKDDKYMVDLFREDIGRARHNLGKTLAEDEKINESQLKNVIRNSIQKAKDEYKDEKDEGKKGDIWDDDIEPCYTIIAKAALPIAYKEHVGITERDEVGKEAKERSEREEKRKNVYRMAA